MKNTEFGFYNDNSARNAPYIKINGVTFYFSYSTLVGVDYSKGLKVRTNIWQSTTGKHLNWLDYGDKKNRLDGAGFAKEAKKAMKEAKITELPTINI